MSGRSWRRASLLGLGLLGIGGVLAGRGQVKPADVEGPGPGLQLESAKLKVEEWLDREVTVPFERETAIAEVASHLAKALKVRVVLDPAAFNRLGLDPSDTIRLSVEGPLRLRTALPLLLDQLELTSKFVPEDRLLILTDGIGAQDGQRQVLEELFEMHRELHDIRDILYEFLDQMAPAEEPGDNAAAPGPAVDPDKGRSS